MATPAWELEPASPVRLHTRSLWTRPQPGEHGAPRRRIIHQRVLFTDEPATLTSIGVAEAPGYHKCASGQERDAALDVRVFAADGSDGWRAVGELTASAEEAYAGTTLDLDSLTTTALVAEVRRAATDDWWPGWNLASGGLQLTGTVNPAWSPKPEGHLEVQGIDVTSLPDGVSARVTATEVRFRSASLEVGFRLTSPAWSYLALDADGDGRTHTNLLQLPRSMDIVRSGVYPSGVYPVLRDQNAEYLAQGPRFTATTGEMPLGFLHSDYVGTTTVTGSTVRYEVISEAASQRYVLEFTVYADRIAVHAERHGSRERRAFTSSAWHVATDNRVTPSNVLGALTFEGETGLIAGGATWHFPRHGSLGILASHDALWRSDSVRPLDTNTLELKIGERPTSFGDYVLPAGSFTVDTELIVATPVLAELIADTPAVVRRALDRHGVTALPFRADTSTYSNNGASMHCTTSLADVSAIAALLPDADHLTPMAWVGDSLQRWLDGAPSYGSGATSHGPHRLEDEYVHMAANTLAALGRFVAAQPDGAWFYVNRERIVDELERMLARDVDGDGLVESTLRRGLSGEHQWSTAWADVISFGWKDAWANAVLFETWQLWPAVLRRHDENDLASRIDAARESLRRAYLPTFFDERTGLIAGWRSQDDVLHNYGFSVPIAAACASELLPVETARGIMESLVTAWRGVGLEDYRNGIPLNLWRIPEDDIGGVIFGLPMGSYQQGGYSHHGARAIIDALDRVGLTDEADRVLEGLCETIGDDTSFGGLGSGRDWRMRDGTPSGYEGQLVEGFSVLASALRRYRTAPAIEPGE